MNPLQLFDFLVQMFQQKPEAIAAFFCGIFITIICAYLLKVWFPSATEIDLARRDAEIARLKEEITRKDADFNKKADELKRKTRDSRKGQAEAGKFAEEIASLKNQRKEIENQRQAIQKDAEHKATDLKKQLAAAQSEHKSLRARAIQKIKNFMEQVKQYERRLASIADQARQVDELQGRFWEAQVVSEVAPFRALKPNKAAIIAVINLKGGVGKTTLSANLGIAFSQIGKRVLLVDLDYQASLTGRCLSQEEMRYLKLGDGKLIDNVFKAKSNFASLALNNLICLQGKPIHLLGCSEGLFDIEERIKAQWLMNLSGFDIRCILREALHGPEIQDRFDVILLDCPPRWTPASINALTSCDYVLIPSMLDTSSAEAIPRLLTWLRNLGKLSIYSNLAVLGIIGNNAYPTKRMIAREKRIWDDSPKQCEDAWKSPVHHFQTIIRKLSSDEKIASLDGNPEIIGTFLALVEEIETQRRNHERS